MEEEEEEEGRGQQEEDEEGKEQQQEEEGQPMEMDMEFDHHQHKQQPPPASAPPAPSLLDRITTPSSSSPASDRDRMADMLREMRSGSLDFTTFLHDCTYTHYHHNVPPSPP